jgi:hypothetical protein
VPIYSSCEEMIADEAFMAKLDGVIICTAHHCHADMGKKFLAAGKHVLMEKPMTVSVPEARELAAAADAAAPKLAFMVNNTANYRAKCFEARRLVEAGELGDIHHVMCYMCVEFTIHIHPLFLVLSHAHSHFTQPCIFFTFALLFCKRDFWYDGMKKLSLKHIYFGSFLRLSTRVFPIFTLKIFCLTLFNLFQPLLGCCCCRYSPLMFLFDDPANDGWVKATGDMLQPDGSGNGFGYGQLSHLLGWVIKVFTINTVFVENKRNIKKKISVFAGKKTAC